MTNWKSSGAISLVTDKRPACDAAGRGCWAPIGRSRLLCVANHTRRRVCANSLRRCGRFRRV